MTKEIHFVTGKGGVGKSMVAAALAFKSARDGKRTLLVELGERSFYKDFFEQPQIGFKPHLLRENLDLALWSGTDSLRDYARHLIKIEALTKIFFENPVSRSLLEVAPALSELAILGKITSGPRNHGPAMPYDVIIVDAYSTGHFLALIRAPHGMSEAIRFGPMGEQSRSIDAVLRNKDLCRTHLVTLPEEMPVKEAEELIDTLRREFDMRVEVIMNKVLEIPEGEPPAEAKDFSDFLKSTRERQVAMHARLQKMNVPLRSLPLLLQDEPVQLTEDLSAKLTGEQR